MPRKPLIYTDSLPYHITNRSNNKEFFYLELKHLWPIFFEVIEECQKQFGGVFSFFVLMSNHYHLIVRTPDSNIGEIMKYFHREVARKANKKAGRINHFFGGRYKWCVIDTEQYYWNAVKYVLRNPVSAGICTKIEDYKYSSFNTDDELWQITDFYDETKQVELDRVWLNEKNSEEVDRSLRLALRKREFRLMKDKDKREIVELDEIDKYIK